MFTTATRLYYDSVQSTNTTAREIIRNSNPKEGTIIIAREQRAGRGYLTNTWESEPGTNLTVSLILKPVFLEPQKQFELTKVFSLAISDLMKDILEQTKETVTIKWPNDIYIGEKKVAGILAENSIMGNTIKDCVCGIGINVNQLRFISEAPNPVSLRQITGIVYSLHDLLDLLTQKLDHWYHLLVESDLDAINRHYHENLFRKDLLCWFESGGMKFRGTILHTDMYGRLLIQKENEELKVFDFKEVSFVFED